MKPPRYAQEALRDLRRHANVAPRVMKAIGDHAADPAAHGNNETQLVGHTAKRLRVGDFRVIFEETDTEILVTRAAPRGSAYDRLAWRPGGRDERANHQNPNR